MTLLIIVSVIWAFSFGLIGNHLVGLDPFLVASIRLAIAFILFLPALRLSKLPAGQMLRLLGCGAIQFGLMYVCYIKAFAYLPSHLVALFSVLTPLYVVLIHNLRKGSISRIAVLAALLSVAGAAVIKAKDGSAENIWMGFALMQIAGISFAFGQIYYRAWKRSHAELSDHHVFAILYAGGCLLATAFSLRSTDWSTLQIAPVQWLVLLYLGSVASGLGFFLWNKGAAQANAGTLAACNNAVVPLGMLCSLFIFGEIQAITPMALLRLLLGSLLIATAVFIAEQAGRRGSAEG